MNVFILLLKNDLSFDANLLNANIVIFGCLNFICTSFFAAYVRFPTDRPIKIRPISKTFVFLRS